VITVKIIFTIFVIFVYVVDFGQMLTEVYARHQAVSIDMLQYIFCNCCATLRLFPL